MSLSSLLDTITATVCGVAPALVPGIPFAVRRMGDSPMESTRVVDIGAGPPTDTGLVSGSTLDEVRHDMSLSVAYLAADIAHAEDVAPMADVIASDARLIISALRPVTVWQADAASLDVDAANTVTEPITDADGTLLGTRLSIPIIALVR